MSATAKRSMPPPLRKGDTVGLVAPAGPVADRAAFEAGIRLLHDMGFQVKHQRDIKRGRGYLAGTDRQRITELHDLWRDPEVKALLAVRGGYGCLRLLAGIDMELLRRYPKMLMGFSDLTALHAVILRHTDFACFHGPMLTTLAKSDKPSVERFFQALSGRLPETFRPEGLEILAAGEAQGPLLGGNLTTLVHLLGTPYELSWDNAILFLEDVGEAPYRIDRMLTHLKEAGRLDNIAGLVLGSFKDCGNIEKIWQRALEVSGNAGIPIWAGFPAGHGPANHVLPLGCTVSLESGRGIIRFQQK